MDEFELAGSRLPNPCPAFDLRARSHRSLAQVVRSRLYTALLHYLKLTQPGDDDPSSPSMAGITDTQLAHQSMRELRIRASFLRY